MKKNYVNLLLAILFVATTFAQETQKNFINYQGVARNSENALMEQETLEIEIAIKFGSANANHIYAENHSVTTDANGVFSLLIGNGNTVTGNYNTLPWGSGATFVTVSVNGNQIGTNEMMAVPYALSSGDGAQDADQVPYDNSISGLTAINTQQAIDELVGSGVVDADSDPTNELQDLTLSGTDLSISEGSTIDLSGIVPAGGADDQNAAEVPFDNTASGLIATDTQAAIDEMATTGLVNTDDQDLSLSGTILQITDGADVDLAAIIPPGGTDDQNATEVPFDNTASGLIATDTQAAIDELATSGLVDTDDQDLSLAGTILQITDGASVDLTPIIPPGGTDNQNAAEVPFDNTTSGLIATDTQSAIDELATTGLVNTDDQDLSLSGTILQITDGMSVDLAPIIPPGGTDNQNATEVPFDNAASGLIATDTQAAIDELAASGTVDTDNQKLIFEGTTNILEIEDGNTVDLSSLAGGSSLWEANGGDVYYAAGNVGVGITDPEMKLHVGGSMLVQTDLGNLQLGYSGDGNRWSLNTIGGGANLQFRSKPSGSTAYTTRFRMRQNGEFQVGNISNVSAWAHVRNNSTINKPQLKLEEVGNDYARLELTNDAANGAYWHMAGLPSTTTADAKLNFYFRNADGAADRMTITGDGEVGINGAPTARLHIHQRSQSVGTGLRFTDNTANGDWDITHGFALRFHYGGALRGYINANTGAYTQSSDGRLKAKISILPKILDKVGLLRPTTYHYKSDKSQTKTMGFVAQEVQQVFPELVSYSEIDDIYGIDYSGFGVVAIRAIQEQQEIITGQNQKIADLEERLIRLEARFK